MTVFVEKTSHNDSENSLVKMGGYVVAVLCMAFLVRRNIDVAMDLIIECSSAK